MGPCTRDILGHEVRETSVTNAKPSQTDIMSSRTGEEVFRSQWGAYALLKSARTPEHSCCQCTHKNDGGETDGRISVDSAANLLEVVGNKRVSVFKDEDEVFKLLSVKEVVVEVRMGIGNKASFCIVGNIADVEGMVTEGRSLDTRILGICGWDFDIVEVERNRCA
ncbi:hypothetical protein TNCV_99671 [Trichonephila clavipes]|nr:hypothetical protein TNCV_99671 [Trichonephila clavipes]